jgi:hypothetical protein
MPVGNQSYYKSINESVEKYVLLVKDYQGKEYISGIYDKIAHLKSGLKNCDHLGWDSKREYRVAKAKITIEELESNVEI